MPTGPPLLNSPERRERERERESGGKRERQAFMLVVISFVSADYTQSKL